METASGRPASVMPFGRINGAFYPMQGIFMTRRYDFFQDEHYARQVSGGVKK